jgi:hypothetical protein
MTNKKRSKNTAEQAIAALTALGPLDELGLTFTVLVPDDVTQARAYRVQITEAARLELAKIAEHTRERVVQDTRIDYGPAVLIPSSHCMQVSQDGAAMLSAIQGQVDKADADAFNSSATYASKAMMVAARFSKSNGESVTFYRVADSLLQLSKKKILGLILRDGCYDRLEPAQILLMRSEFDVVVIDRYAFFFAKTRFEQAFGFLGELKKASGETFDAVTKKLRINGIEDLRKACISQPQMMAKMASIRRSMRDDARYKDAMTMPKLVAFIKGHPTIDIQIEGRGINQRLVFDSAPATRFKILNLLDDDYLSSTLTQLDYEANSKVRA